MITPTRIEVCNIGSITHAVIEPDQHGITALDGKTGTGKSTIVNAMVWCLYGHVGGVASFTRQSELRSDHCPEGEHAECSVTFTHGGVEITATRRLRRTKRGKETAHAALVIDGTKQRGITPDTLTDKIVEMTGMSGRAYTSAFFIPQHHLERLAMGTPTEVQNAIEDQTGLGVLTRQIADASAEVRDATTAADALPGTAEEVEQTAATLDAAQRDGVATWEAFEAAAEIAGKAREAFETARGVVEGLQERREKARAAEIAHARAVSRAEAAEQAVAELTAEVEGVTSVDAQALSAERDRLRTVLGQVERAETRWNTTTEQATTCAAGLEQARRMLAAADSDRAEEQHRAAEADRQRAETALGVLRARYRQADASLRALDAAEVGHTCPTCEQAVTDPAALREHLVAERDQIRAEAAEQTTASRAAADQIARWAEQVGAARKAAAEVAAAQAACDRATTAKNDAFAAASEAAAALREAVPDGAGATMDMPAAREAVTARCDQITADLAAHEHHMRARDRLAAATETAQTARAAAAQAQTAATDTVDEAEWEQARTAAQTAEAQWRDADTARQDAQIAAQAARGRAEEAERVHAAEVAVFDKKVAALRAADTARYAHHVLTVQRHALLAEYTAAISAAASDLMAAAGGGRHVGVVVDETFVPRVVLADGRERPFRNLSGGEKARAALCLCLGQATAGTATAGGGMIVADEIATGYDTETTAAVVEMIRGLGQPMLLIGHNPEIRQIANKVYAVTHSEERGSTVTDTSVTAAAVEAATTAAHAVA